MSYEPKLAAALSGATTRQLAHWRKATAGQGAILITELSRPVLYSFRCQCGSGRRREGLRRVRGQPPANA